MAAVQEKLTKTELADPNKAAGSRSNQGPVTHTKNVAKKSTTKLPGTQPKYNVGNNMYNRESKMAERKTSREEKTTMNGLWKTFNGQAKSPSSPGRENGTPEKETSRKRSADDEEDNPAKMARLQIEMLEKKQQGDMLKATEERRDGSTSPVYKSGTSNNKDTSPERRVSSNSPLPVASGSSGNEKVTSAPNSPTHTKGTNHSRTANLTNSFLTNEDSNKSNEGDAPDSSVGSPSSKPLNPPRTSNKDRNIFAIGNKISSLRGLIKAAATKVGLENASSDESDSRRSPSVERKTASSPRSGIDKGNLFDNLTQDLNKQESLSSSSRTSSSMQVESSPSSGIKIDTTNCREELKKYIPDSADKKKQTVVISKRTVSAEEDALIGDGDGEESLSDVDDSILDEPNMSNSESCLLEKSDKTANTKGIDKSVLHDNNDLSETSATDVELKTCHTSSETNSVNTVTDCSKCPDVSDIGSNERTIETTGKDCSGEAEAEMDCIGHSPDTAERDRPTLCKPVPIESASRVDPADSAGKVDSIDGASTVHGNGSSLCKTDSEDSATTVAADSFLDSVQTKNEGSSEQIGDNSASEAKTETSKTELQSPVDNSTSDLGTAVKPDAADDVESAVEVSCSKSVDVEQNDADPPDEELLLMSCSPVPGDEAAQQDDSSNAGKILSPSVAIMDGPKRPDDDDDLEIIMEEPSRCIDVDKDGPSTQSDQGDDVCILDDPPSTTKTDSKTAGNKTGNKEAASDVEAVQKPKDILKPVPEDETKVENAKESESTKKLDSHVEDKDYKELKDEERTVSETGLKLITSVCRSECEKESMKVSSDASQSNKRSSLEAPDPDTKQAVKRQRCDDVVTETIESKVESKCEELLNGHADVTSPATNIPVEIIHDSPRKEESDKSSPQQSLNELIKKKMKQYLASAECAQVTELQKRIDQLKLMDENWRKQVQELQKQVSELTRAQRNVGRRRQPPRVPTRNMSIQVDENKIQHALSQQANKAGTQKGQVRQGATVTSKPSSPQTPSRLHPNLHTSLIAPMGRTTTIPAAVTTNTLGSIGSMTMLAPSNLPPASSNLTSGQLKSVRGTGQRETVKTILDGQKQSPVASPFAGAQSTTVRELLDSKRHIVSTDDKPDDSTAGNKAVPTGKAPSTKGVIDLTDDDEISNRAKPAMDPRQVTFVRAAQPVLQAPPMMGSTLAVRGPNTIAGQALRPGQTLLIQQTPGGPPPGTYMVQHVLPQGVRGQAPNVRPGTLMVQATPPAGGFIRQTFAGQAPPQLRPGVQPAILQKPAATTAGITRPPPPLQSAPRAVQTQASQQDQSVTSSTLPTKATAAKPTTVVTNAKPTKPLEQKTKTANCQHPAPLPPQPVSDITAPDKKMSPPKPNLKISRVSQGIVLSWNMNLANVHSDVSSYQLFAYQEGSALPTPNLWKKVGDVKALPLPMACTLTQFQEGNKYHFAVRAVDKHGRVGPFSDPSSIHLTPTVPGS